MSNRLLEGEIESYLSDYSEYLLRYRGLSDATVTTYSQDLNTFVAFLAMSQIRGSHPDTRYLILARIVARLRATNA